jgi:hypothetical protein
MREVALIDKCDECGNQIRSIGFFEPLKGKICLICYFMEFERKLSEYR